MILVLPLVLLALAAAGGATGIAFGAKGAVDIASAQGKIDEAKKRYEQQRLVTDNAAVLTNRLAQEYGQCQMHVKTVTFQRWMKLMQKIRQNVALREMQRLVGIEVVIQEIKRDFGVNLNAENVFTGGATAAGAAFAASQGTIGLVGLFGAASTGTAISSLSGAAAWNATLAALGGYAGDAIPVIRAMAQVADWVVTHPNVLNGAMLYWSLPQVWYVEGYALDRWAAGDWGLQPVHQQRLGVVLDGGMEPDLQLRHRQVIQAAQATLGLTIAGEVLTDEPLGVGLQTADSGATWGTLAHPDSLLRAVAQLKERYQVTAVAVVARFPDSQDEAVWRYRQGQGVDPLAGAEAVISHLVVRTFHLPCAHAPALRPLPLDPTVAPQAAAEELGYTFLPSVLVEHLNKVGAREFGAYWCPHCHQQKQLFGQEASKKIRYIECDPKGVNSQTQLCVQVGIKGYPTWEINGKLYPGVKTLDQLADLTNYQGSRNFINQVVKSQ